jgi:RNA polymerase sigma-70 factor, ECF subfamily
VRGDTANDPPGGDQRSDRELVEALRGGDRTAFEGLWHRHREWVVRLAQRHCGAEADALDVLQETFLYLLRKLPTLTLTARLTTFLFPVVRNLALQRVRQRARTEPPPPDVLDEHVSLVPTEDLVAALANLPPEQQQAVLLRFVDGLSLQEVADRQAVPLGTVKSRLFQALATLRQDPVARRYFLA